MTRSSLTSLRLFGSFGSMRSSSGTGLTSSACSMSLRYRLRMPSSSVGLGKPYAMREVATPKISVNSSMNSKRPTITARQASDQRMRSARCSHAAAGPSTAASISAMRSGTMTDFRQVQRHDARQQQQDIDTPARGAAHRQIWNHRYTSRAGRRDMADTPTSITEPCRGVEMGCRFAEPAATCPSIRLSTHLPMPDCFE